MIQVADVSEDEGAAQAKSSAEVSIRRPRGECVCVHAVRQDADALGRHAAVDDVGAHRLGNRQHVIRCEHRAGLSRQAALEQVAGVVGPLVL